MKLVQVRRCDGQCCKESPRFPSVDNTDCVYRKSVDGKETLGCMLMTGEAKIPEGESVVWPGRPAEETFNETCVDWPQNSPYLRGTGGCCWQWVNGD